MSPTTMSLKQAWGHADVHHLACALGVPEPVRTQHHDLPVESLEAEHVAVERVFAGEEGIPVGVVPFAVDDLALHRMASAGGQQCNLAQVPLVGVGDVSEDVIGSCEGLVEGHIDELDRVTAVQPHDLRFRSKPGDRLDDGVDVAQVLPKVEGVHGDRCGPGAVEDPLVLIREGIQDPCRRFLQTRFDCLPPDVGEVLALVDDDRVEQLGILLLQRKVVQLLRQFDLPVMGVVIVTGVCAPLQRQVMEQTHIGRALRGLPLGDGELHEAGETAGIAHDRDPHPVPCQLPGFEQGQVRLARTGAAAELGAGLVAQH